MSKNDLLCLVFWSILIVGLLPIKLSAQLIEEGTTVNAFIRNEGVQAGINMYGCYGSTLKAPEGYSHGINSDRETNGLVGFLVSHSKNWDQQSNIYGDFILPGTPYEGFSVIFTPGSGEEINYVNDRDYSERQREYSYKILPDEDNPFTVNNPEDPKNPFTDVTWHGKSNDGKFKIDCRFKLEGFIIHHYTTITNTSNEPLNNVYYTRGMDPDQEVGGIEVSKRHHTWNIIESQADGTQGKPSWVIARGLVTPAMIAYYSNNPQSRVAVSTSWRQLLYYPKSAYSETGESGIDGLYIKDRYSQSQSADYSIELTINVGTIPVGGSVTVEHEIRLDQPAIVHFEESLEMPLEQTKNEGDIFTYTLTRKHQLDTEVVATIQLSAESETTMLTANDFVKVTSLPHEYTVTFPPNVTTQIISVETALDNTTPEEEETFELKITKVKAFSGGQPGLPNIVKGTIIDIPSIATTPECTNCPGSFAPYPGKEYVFGGWVKDATALADGAVTYKNNCHISLSFDLVGTDTPFDTIIQPTGAIIDGWQRMQEVVKIPSNAHTMRLELVNNTGSDDHEVYFDDIRVYPANGSMKSYVYDPVTRRLVAELDEENYATFYEYDEEGALIRVKKETERGIMTIREARQGQRKQP